MMTFPLKFLSLACDKLCVKSLRFMATDELNCFFEDPRRLLICVVCDISRQQYKNYNVVDCKSKEISFSFTASE